MAAQIGQVHQFNVIGVASESKRQLIEATGATFVKSGDGAADRVRAIAPEGADLFIDLVGGDALRQIAAVAKQPERIVSTADPETAEELGGAGVQRTKEGLAKVTEVAEYGLVTPNVVERFSLQDAQQAIATVEDGHAAGKVIIEP